jgi:hypothetical protein
MPEFRDLLTDLLARTAAQRGDCPDCYGSGQLHTVLNPTNNHEHDLDFHVALDPRCGGTGWLSGAFARPRSCRRCGRIFQPWVNALGEFGYCCTFCTSDWRHARWAAASDAGSAPTLPGSTFALPPTRPGSYGPDESRPGAANGGTSANDSVGAGLDSHPRRASHAQFNRQERTAQPVGQGRRGQPAQGRQGSPAAQGTRQPAHDPAPQANHARFTDGHRLLFGRGHTGGPRSIGGTKLA